MLSTVAVGLLSYSLFMAENIVHLAKEIYDWNGCTWVDSLKLAGWFYRNYNVTIWGKLKEHTMEYDFATKGIAKTNVPKLYSMEGTAIRLPPNCGPNCNNEIEKKTMVIPKVDRCKYCWDYDIAQHCWKCDIGICIGCIMFNKDWDHAKHMCGYCSRASIPEPDPDIEFDPKLE